MQYKVLYTGAILDLSGYAEAARGYIRALDNIGIDVAANPKSFEKQQKNLIDQTIGRKIWTLIGKPKNTPIHIIHLTPDNYKEFKNSAQYKIGYYAWETSRLPAGWVKSINETVKEAWVPSEYLKNISETSGVTVPVKVLPHVVPVIKSDWVPPCKIDGVDDSKFNFYSIFQWSERKGAEELIRAYYEEFDINDPVRLIIKTYKTWDTRDVSYIRKRISLLKRATKGVNCPPILLIEDFLSPIEIMSLHKFCDCYVCMAKSEAFGLTIFDAAAMGNPVIVPNYSAFPEHFNHETAYIIDVEEEIPVRNMNHISILYTGDMLWGNPSIESCKQQMRRAFENREEASQKGKLARDYIKRNLGLTSIGRIMKSYLDPVGRSLNG